jgi:tRNA dimethylallyltransferase
MIEPIYIVGPTAAGKSDVAAELAVALGGEVVGADAFQVYRGLDLLTAKPSATVLSRAPHHLMGEIPLTESFDVEQYRRLASERMAQIVEQGRVPIVVGGTGLYVRALTHGLATLPPGDESLRAQLATEPLEALQRRLRELDPIAATQVDLKNPRRVIRALEVCLLTGRPFSSFREEWKAKPQHKGVLIHLDRDALRRRIVRRTETMFAAGVVDEVRGVDEISLTASQAIGFVEIRALLAGEIEEVECRERITVQTQQYAKRQMTWFRRGGEWDLVEISEDEAPSTGARRIVSALDRHRQKDA